jgi:hypothetical protein
MDTNNSNNSEGSSSRGSCRALPTKAAAVDTAAGAAAADNVADAAGGGTKKKRANSNTNKSGKGKKKKKTSDSSSKIKDEADAVAAAAAINKKPPNFTDEEKYYLCRAWVAASEDPIAGTEMKGDTFWKKVKDCFNSIYEEESDVVVVHTLERDWTSLKNRWQRHIMKPFGVYAGFYRRIKEENPSGGNEEKIRKDAAEMYRVEEGKPFKLMNCIDVLIDIPKFEPFHPQTDEEKQQRREEAARQQLANNLNDFGTTMGGNLERPIGNKSAKKHAKESVSYASVTMQKISFMGNVETTNSRIVEAADTLNLHMNRKTQLDTLALLYKMHMQFNNRDEAQKCMGKMQVLQDKNHKDEEALSNRLLAEAQQHKQQHEPPTSVTVVHREMEAMETPLAAGGIHAGYERAETTSPTISETIKRMEEDSSDEDQSSAAGEAFGDDDVTTRTVI